jgi:octaprenyl-diphosphate synthase
MDQIQEIIHSTGALEYTIRKARNAANSAIARLDDIPDSEYRQTLMSLARLAIQRRS